MVNPALNAEGCIYFYKLIYALKDERSRKYTIQDRYSTVPEQLTARHRPVNIGSREQPGVAQS